jgi:hypothetical protein
MRKIVTALVVAEILAATAGAAFAAPAYRSMQTSDQSQMSDNFWARNGAAAVQIQEEYEQQSRQAGN